jgi:hypothetical protein
VKEPTAIVVLRIQDNNLCFFFYNLSFREEKPYSISCPLMIPPMIHLPRIAAAAAAAAAAAVIAMTASPLILLEVRLP